MSGFLGLRDGGGSARAARSRAEPNELELLRELERESPIGCDRTG